MNWLLSILDQLPAGLVPIAIVVLVLVLLFVLGRGIFRAWPTIKQFVLTVNAITGLPEFMDRTDATLAGQDQKIAEIHHEVHFNNGTSVKDAATRTEKAVGRVERGVKGLYKEIEVLKAVDAVLRSDLEKTQPKHPTQGEPQ